MNIAITIEVEVLDPAALWDAAHIHLQECGVEDAETSIGTKEAPRPGICLQMLLDRGENLPGCNIISSSHDANDEEDEPTIAYRIHDIEWHPEVTMEELAVEATLNVPERLCPPPGTDMGAWFDEADATIPTTEDAKKALNFIDWVNDWLDDNEGCLHEGWKAELVAPAGQER